MTPTVVARGLQFPEGPVWHDDSLLITEIVGGRIARWRPGSGEETDVIAETGGGPNGATLGPDGALYVTQNGGMFSEVRVEPGIVRVDLADGSWDYVATEVAGRRLGAPNDLAFGPDGRLWFTDPNGPDDPSKNQNPGRLFAFDVASGVGELIRELGPVFPNGIAFDPAGRLLWTESFTRQVVAGDGDETSTLLVLPERHYPDGFCVGADGTLYVGATYAHCVAVVRDGEIVDRLPCGDAMITNCCFGGPDGRTLYATDSRRGLIWAVELDGPGLPLH
ncbi:MAG: SMP-30/gluconolactonase/LRE family protein [Desertimonas sp.]